MQVPTDHGRGVEARVPILGTSRTTPHAKARDLRQIRQRALEWEVVDQIMLGMSNDQLADQLGISLATVKTHVSHILQKLDLKRREELQSHPGVQVRRARD